MTAMTKDNATKMTAFWKAFWAAKARNDTAVMAACERMAAAASKHQPANDADWQTVSTATK